MKYYWILKFAYSHGYAKYTKTLVTGLIINLIYHLNYLERQSGQSQGVGQGQVKDVDVSGCFHLCVSEERRPTHTNTQETHIKTKRLAGKINICLTHLENLTSCSDVSNVKLWSWFNITGTFTGAMCVCQIILTLSFFFWINMTRIFVSTMIEKNKNK